MAKPNLETDAEPINSPPHQLDDVQNEMVSRDWNFNDGIGRIVKKISNADLKHMKFLLSGEGGAAKGVLEKIEDGFDLIKYLQNSNKLDKYNLIHLQALIWATENRELHEKLVKFASFCEQQPLHFFQPSEPLEGRSNAKFHVRGKVTDRTNVEILRGLVAGYLRVPDHEVYLNGIIPFNSIVVTFSVPKRAVQTLKNLTTYQKASLKKCNVDRFVVDGEETVLVDKTFDGPPSLSESDEVKRVLKINSKLENELSHVHEMLLHKHEEKNIEQLERVFTVLQNKVMLMSKDPGDQQTERSFDKQMKEFQSQYPAAVEDVKQLLIQKERMVHRNHADFWKSYEGCIKALRVYVYGMNDDPRRHWSTLRPIEETETQSNRAQGESKKEPIFMQSRYKDALQEISVHLTDDQKDKLRGCEPFSESEKQTLKQDHFKFMQVLLQRNSSEHQEEIENLHDHVMKMLSILNDKELNSRAEDLFKAACPERGDIVRHHRQRKSKQHKDPKNTTMIFHRSKSVSLIPTESMEQQMEELLTIVNNIAHQIVLPEVTTM